MFSFLAKYMSTAHAATPTVSEVYIVCSLLFRLFCAFVQCSDAFVWLAVKAPHHLTEIYLLNSSQYVNVFQIYKQIGKS